MSDETQEATGGDSGGTAPGVGAGDRAGTQQIPRLSKPVEATGSSDEAGRPDEKPGKKNQGKNKPPKADSSPQPSDKAAKPEEPEKAAKPDRPAQPPAKPGPRTAVVPPREGGKLDKSSYARTTSNSPESTAVIPVVNDDAPAGTGGRQARLRLAHIEPWSVTRLAFAVSVAMMIVSVVAVTIFWVVLHLTGVWGQINDAVSSVLSDGSSSFDITDYLSFWRLVGLSLVISAINVILMTALATIAARVYNLAAQLLGGVDVTFADD